MPGSDHGGAGATIDVMVIPDDLGRIIEAQDGIVTRKQALDHSISAGALRHALRAGGQWRRIHRGVYATFNGPMQHRHVVRAALLLAGPGAMVTGASACGAYGMRYVPEGGLIILVPASTKRRHVPGIEFRRTRTLPRPRNVSSIPCAPPERAAIDAVANISDMRTVRAALCEAVQCGLTTVDLLLDMATRLQCRNPNVRRALADVTAGCRSAPECELRDLIRASNVLPEPEWNHRLPGIKGAAIVPDGHWKKARLVVEIDSVEWHRLGGKPEATERRRARLAACGWRVMPVSPRRLREAPQAVLRELEDAYLAGVCQSGGRVPS